MGDLRRAWVLSAVAGFLLASGAGAGRAQQPHATDTEAVALIVRGPDGRPLRSHNVLVSRLGPFARDAQAVSAATDSLGRVTVDMPVGQMRLLVRAPGIGFGATGVIEVGPGREVTAALPPLAPFAQLSGTVAPAFRRTGQFLRMEDKFAAPSAASLSVPVDAQGRFAVRDLPPGQFQIEMDGGLPRGNYYFSFQIAPGEDRGGIVLAPSVPTLLFPPYVAPPATRTVTLRGTVTDDRGRPIAGATVYAKFPDPQFGGMSFGAFPGGRNEPAPLSTVTGLDGGFTFPAVSVPDVAFTVPVAAAFAGHAPAFASVRSTPDAPSDLRAGLVLSTQHAALTARVTTPGGKPVAGVPVRLRPSEGIPGIAARPEDEPARQFFVPGFGAGANSMSALFTPRSVTGPDGAARFADLPPGLWDVEAGDVPGPGAFARMLSAQKPGAGRVLSARSLGVAVQVGQDSNYVLALSPDPAAPTVRVLSPDGRPVRVQGAYLEPGSTITDSHVFADHDPNTSDAPSDAPITVPTARPGLWRVTANYRENSESDTTYGSSLYGSYIPEPYIAAGALVALSPALPPPGLLVLRARRRAGGKLRVRLEGVDGRPATGTVFVPSINGAPEYAATVGADGEAVFSAMPAGNYTLVGSLSGASTPPTLAALYGGDTGPLPTDAALAGRTCLVSQTATVALDVETRVVLRAVRAGFVRGHIVPVPGTPLSHYSLTPRYVPGYGVADAAGRINPRTGEFVYGPLPPGPAHLSLECEDMVQRRPFPVHSIVASVVGGRVTSLAPIVAAALPLFTGLDPVRGVVLLHDGVTPAWGAQTVLFTPSPSGLVYPAVTEQAPADALGRLTGADVGPAGGYYGPYSTYARGSVVTAGQDPDGPTLIAWMPGLTGAVLVPCAQGRDVRVVLPPPSHISGRVTVGGRSALGLPGTIRVRAAYQGRGRLNALLSRDVTARPDGAFRLDGLTPGAYQVQAARDGVWLSAALPLTVGAAENDPRAPALDIGPAGAPVVLHLAGAPGRTVRLDRPPGPLADELWPATVTADGAGDLRLDGLEAGRHAVYPAEGGPAIMFDVPPARLPAASP